LYDEKKSSTDLNVLLTIGALRPSFKIIRPVYDSFGTITARTKIVTPNLQNLSKRFRTIIAPAAGKTLIYIDYAQFEAGILAQDSGDTLLIAEYNAKYIYAEIGNRIEIQKFLPNIEDQKKFCKSLFYKFSYGMDISQHIQILKDFKLESHAAALSPKIIKAFASYSSLNMYRMKINEELLSQQKIGTFDGNYRYLFENEQRTSWAISQRIQGTASLILKKAIIELYDNDKEIEFLIPMHDAALFQVP
jgi:DNA polymerase I-like protein with 3'-5' exonuclease and polymerase domains